MTSQTAVLILGDQLSLDNPALQSIPAADKASTPVIMVEAMAEAKVVWVHKARIAVFLSAMRHFAQQLREAGYSVIYSTLSETGGLGLVERVAHLCQQHNVQTLHVTEPGEWRLEQALVEWGRQSALQVRMFNDTHFLCTRAEFAAWASKYKQLRMEFFYREMRKRHSVLMDGHEPAGGQWNFDADNRSAYPKSGPGAIEAPLWFKPDVITSQVLTEVEATFPDHPGQLARFQWAVTRDQALLALNHFVNHRLPQFGQFQDAMWTKTPFGWHSLISAAINLHLLNPKEVIQAAEDAYQQGAIPLASAEGFIRQILGWREFIRGVYWLDMPHMRQANALSANAPLPEWFWTGQTHMACLQDSIGQTLEYGYAHHIQRLMVIGNFALLAGLSPQAVEDWFLAVYVDAVEWVELPNVAGMALFANGGRFTSKPYVASGAYISRMSNYCNGCRYKPAVKTGPQACPFTTLYWGFIDQHHAMLSANPRTALMAKNLNKMSEDDLEALRAQLAHLHAQMNTL